MKAYIVHEDIVHDSTRGQAAFQDQPFLSYEGFLDKTNTQI